MTSSSNSFSDIEVAAKMPLKGVYYLLNHPSLWPHVVFVFIIQVAIFIVVYTLYLPIHIILTVFFTLIFAPLFFVCQIGSFFTVKVWSSKIGRKLLYKRKVLNSTFDEVLKKEGYHELVLRGKYLRRSTAVSMGESQLMKLMDLPFIPKAVIDYLSAYIVKFTMLLVYPALAPLAFLLGRGLLRGQRAQSRYFELKGWDYRQKQRFLKSHRDEHLTFGMICGVLIHIPFCSSFFQVASTCGAALWSIDMEEKRKTKYKGDRNIATRTNKRYTTKNINRRRLSPFNLK
ncbi:hypothetical protein WICPIJ_002465 [Wickerhamomyces pijperi]|uniref:Outer spore wall protein RRT8 n=1 Tax=Wickerhamomyces pijperi TaxID=599730 RepID=A0A9P8Q8Y8_WICPI|nr:hypothetical protein WICPIJ_002465 [Wickerhamomyces pijperi]